ncbi:unnamed protein product [Rhodiola kirilowii]
MAGQIQEPISFNFQADSVHSGSVSFGRFANEPLLWERRSSFSHNRILEEVERCSKHGIVTEKKAYFEAQFKKKALLRQCSLDEQYRTQYEACEKESPALSHKEDYEFVQGNENDASCDTSVGTGYRENYEFVREAQGDVHFNDSDASNDFKEMEIVEYASSDSFEAKVDARIVAPVDAQTVVDCTYSICSSVEVEVKQNTESARSGKAEKGHDEVSNHRDLCHAITVVTEPSGTESNVNVNHTQRHSLSEAGKKSFRNITGIGKLSAQETKALEHSKVVPSSASKWPRSPNTRQLLTQSTSSISKSLSGSKSGYKETRVVKVTESQVTAMKKGPPTAHQTPNRAEKVTAPNSSGLKTSSTSFRLRSDVRAENSKEILKRTEQSSHIKKTEMSLNYARTQEKTANDIKQSRRGLNLKAKPMPSFCNEAERHELNSKDAKVNEPQKNPSNPRTKVVARSSMHLKAEGGPSKSPSQVSTLTSDPGKKPLKTSGVSSFAKKSIHPSRVINSASTKEIAGKGKDVKLKALTGPQNVEVIKGKGMIRTSQSVNERSSKCMTRKTTEKARPQEINRPAAKVH